MCFVFLRYGEFSDVLGTLSCDCGSDRGTRKVLLKLTESQFCKKVLSDLSWLDLFVDDEENHNERCYGDVTQSTVRVVQACQGIYSVTNFSRGYIIVEVLSHSVTNQMIFSQLFFSLVSNSWIVSFLFWRMNSLRMRRIVWKWMLISFLRVNFWNED
jgi:hypothetical protein